jgi:hypothetical protein
MSTTERQDESERPRKIPALMTAAWEATTSEPDPLAALGASRALAGLLSTWDAQLVGEAVAEGATWEVIGGTVGVTRQAAWERFHGDVHEFRQSVKSDIHDLRDRHRKEMLELTDSIKVAAKKRRRPDQ